LGGLSRWSDRLSEAFQADFIIDVDTPSFSPGGTPITTSWFVFVHYYLYDFSDKLLGFWRAELFRDNQGAATGVPGTYFEMTLGSRYKFKPWLWVRPEVRYDWTTPNHPYNEGTRASQFTIALDCIVLF
jgi:hypothetical protein